MQLSLFESGRVALVSCSAVKAAERRPAERLYLGQLFALSVEWVRLCSYVYPRWAILSAEHGLVMPHEELDPYDTRMRNVDGSAWGELVAVQLRQQFGVECIFTVLAGTSYTSPLLGRLPYVENLFGHWREQHSWKHPRARWGIGKIKQRLQAENARLRAAWAELEREDVEGLQP